MMDKEDQITTQEVFHLLTLNRLCLKEGIGPCLEIRQAETKFDLTMDPRLIR